MRRTETVAAVTSDCVEFLERAPAVGRRCTDHRLPSPGGEGHLVQPHERQEPVVSVDAVLARRNQRLSAAPHPDAGKRASADASAGSVARVRRFILFVAIFTRLLGLAIFTADVGIGWYHHGLSPAVVFFAGAVLAESSLFIAVCWIRGEASRFGAGADAVCIALGLVVYASHRSDSTDPWTFMFQFSLISAVIIGVSFRRLSTAVLWQCVPAGAYAATALFERNAGWNVPQDLVNYLGVVALAWTVCSQLRRSARGLDKAQAEALARETALATERERSRSVRLLHDSVLQTLETLARGRFIDNEAILAQVRKDAFWLRRLVQGAPAFIAADGGDLGAALAAAVEGHIAAGLRVRLYADDAGVAPAPTVTEATAAAVGEALTNVRKHAGTTSAVVRAAPEGVQWIKVSVVDDGCGFNTPLIPAGTGLRESIIRRIEQVGGQVQVDSTPGGGTCITMRIPAARDHGGGT
jgi:signal transduction histidine kinase